jgi:hypothetical protein
VSRRAGGTAWVRSRRPGVVRLDAARGGAVRLDTARRGTVRACACASVAVRRGLRGADLCRDLDHLDDLRDDVEGWVRRCLEDLAAPAQGG